MKKVIIIAMLLSVLCVCGLSAGVCFADETSTYYYVNKDIELTMYSAPQNQSGAVMNIPSTYAFEYVGEASNGYIEIKYNNVSGYITSSDFNAKCTLVNEKWGNNNYAYTFDLSDFALSESNITIYKYDDTNVLTPLKPTPHDYIILKKVKGYLKIGQQTYFLVDYVLDLGTEPKEEDKYIRSTDFKELADISKIPDSKGYTLQTTPDKKPDDVINSGNVDNTTNPPQSTNNNLDRYILIAVIAVLCVVIMILIFVPNRKRQN